MRPPISCPSSHWRDALCCSRCGVPRDSLPFAAGYLPLRRRWRPPALSPPADRARSGDVLDRAKGSAIAQANMSVVTRVVRRNSGENSSAKLGRLSVPASRFCCHTGDSGRKGRMRINGMAGISPDIIV